MNMRQKSFFGVGLYHCEWVQGAGSMWKYCTPEDQTRCQSRSMRAQPDLSGQSNLHQEDQLAPSALGIYTNKVRKAAK